MTVIANFDARRALEIRVHITDERAVPVIAYARVASIIRRDGVVMSRRYDVRTPDMTCA